ncbi:MAG TPA: hypothetical protein VMV77_13205 [Bacteroidales bacterium]|nr:hypothetical protein [Bacteroidales bacterium]
MKRKPFKIIALLAFMIVISCDEPETVVTNFVNSDGTIMRKIEMKNSKNKFKRSDFQVPFDSTWIVTDTCEISEKGDTAWIKRAVKLFKDVNEINLTYKNDSGANRVISRYADFKKTFKWFTTEYHFSETIDKILSDGYPLGDFLDDEELLYFYSPDILKYEQEKSSDSLKYRAIYDTVNQKAEIWATKNLISIWIDEFSKLIEGKKGGKEAAIIVRSHVDDLLKMIVTDEQIFDSLWSNGIILKEYIGESDYERFKDESDTANEKAIENYLVDFKEYSVRISMPGKVTGTNGFIDSSEVLLWPVKSDYFLTETYNMWAESKISNVWAWVVSGLFLVFVITGVIIKIIKRD